MQAKPITPGPRCAPSTGLIASIQISPSGQQIAHFLEQRLCAVGGGGMQQGRLFIRGHVRSSSSIRRCMACARVRTRSAAGYAVVHLEQRLDLQQLAEGGHHHVHAAAALQELERIQRGEDMRALDLRLQHRQHLRHSAPGLGGRFRGGQQLEAHPQAELPRVQHRHRHGRRLPAPPLGHVHHPAQCFGDVDGKDLRPPRLGKGIIEGAELLRGGHRRGRVLDGRPAACGRTPRGTGRCRRGTPGCPRGYTAGRR